MSDFSEYVIDIFRSFGDVSCRKMFGGYGVYYDGLMFGLIADDALYLKADKQGAKLFEERGLLPFKYQKKDKLVTLSYYMAPEELFDDPDEAALWAKRAFQCAVAASAQKKKQKR